MSAEIPVPASRPAGPPATPAGEARIPLPRHGAPPPGAPDVPGYELLARLGRGAQSAVYRARRETDGLEYALKIVDAARLDTSSDLAAFRREAALLASIDHAGLARIHEVGEADGRPYLVMDLIRGRSLADVLMTGPMPPERVVRLGLDIVAPLAAIHGRDLVHRDVKPANVMVLPDGSARLIDFGLTGRHQVARGWAGATRPEPGEDDEAAAPAATSSAAVAGTLAYAPPEQSGTLNRPVDNRSDLYALGVVLFECLAGHLPFQSADVGELLRMHATAAPPDLRELVPGLPPGLAEVVGTLLSKDPDDRYQVGEHVAAHLRALATDPRFRPAAARAPRPIDQGRPMVGRREELARLKERWEQARRGRGGVTLLRGPIGSGKSRVLDEFVARARADGRAVLAGRCVPDDPMPFAPVRAAMDAHLEAVQRLPPDRRAGELAILTAATGRGARASLSGLSPRLARALGVAPDANGAAQDDEQFAQTVIEFLARLATARGELLLVLDDLQWADAGTVLLLRRLAEEIPAVPLLVILGARSEDMELDPAPSPVHAIDLTIDLGPLSDDEVREQVEHLVPGLGSITHLSQLLAVRSNGNPFIVQEYVRAVVDAGLLRPSWGTWVLDVEKLGGLDLPQDAVGLVLTRVRGLRPPVRELLVTAAAMGRRFRAEVVADVSGRDADGVIDDLAEAAGRRLLESLSGGEFGFVHTRIREALLDELDPSERAGLHARIATALDARSARAGWNAEHSFAVAHHYLAARGGPVTVDADRALAVCRQAGRLALEHHSADEAVAFLEYAADLAGDGTADGDLWLLLGTALRNCGRLPDSLHWLRRALAAETDPVNRAEILALVADVHRAQWDAAQACVAIDRGLAEVGAAIPRNRFAAGLATLALYLAARLALVTGLGLGRASGERRRRYEVISRLNDIGAYIGVIDVRVPRVVMHTVRLLHAGVRLGSGPEYVSGQGQFGTVAALAGRRRASRRAFERARADAAYQDPALAAMVEYQAGGAAYMAGWDNGEQLTRAAEEYGRWMDLGQYLDSMGLLHTEATVRGRSADAEYWLARGRARMGARDGLRAFTMSAAVSHALRGEAAGAGEELRRLAGDFDSGKARALGLVRLNATLVILNEQGELGEPFEAAVAELEALGIDPRAAVRPNHGIPLQIALGRLGQLRWADPTSRTARVAAARAAVARLPRKGLSDVLSARAVLARADLLLLEGKPVEALALLNTVPMHFLPDAPLPALEARLVRARVLVAVGAVEEARRLARAAAGIAQEQGWPHRVRAIVSEFGIEATEAGTRPVPSASATSPRTGAERRRLQALEQVGSAASRVLDPQELARITLDETIAILNAERAFLFLLEGDRLVAYYGRDAAGGDVAELTGYSTTLVERVRDTAKPLVVTGTEEGAALGAQSVVLHGLRSIMVAPLLLEARLLGVVYLDSQVAKGIFTPEDASLLTALTNHIATSLETARAAQLEIVVRTVQRQRDVAEMLRQAQDEFSASLVPEEVIVRLLSAAPRMTDCDRTWMISTRADQPDGVGNLLTVGENGLARRVLPIDPAMRRLIDLPGPTVGSAADAPVVLAEELVGAASWIAVPLRADMAGTGVLVLASTRPGADLAPALEVAAALGTLALTAYERAVLFSKVQELAVVDDLTGIPNRRRFSEVAGRDFATARRHGRDVTALMIDIDHFKAVNDTHGHATGDEVIREVARRLAATVRQTDLVARYGGEEFALLLPDAGTDNTLPDRLRAMIADEPIATRSGPLSVTVSVGQAVVLPTDESIEALLARADEALYAAKRQGRNRVCLA